MLNLKLNVNPQTEEKLKTILKYTKDEETFAQSIIDYQIAELQKSISNLKIDLREFEEKYKMSSDIFYNNFSQGVQGDSADFIIWSGIYEMLCENEIKIRELRR